MPADGTASAPPNVEPRPRHPRPTIRAPLNEARMPRPVVVLRQATGAGVVRRERGQREYDRVENSEQLRRIRESPRGGAVVATHESRGTVALGESAERDHEATRDRGGVEPVAAPVFGEAARDELRRCRGDEKRGFVVHDLALEIGQRGSAAERGSGPRRSRTSIRRRTPARLARLGFPAPLRLLHLTQHLTQLVLCPQAPGANAPAPQTARPPSPSGPPSPPRRRR